MDKKTPIESKGNIIRYTEETTFIVGIQPTFYKNVNHNYDENYYNYNYYYY